MTGTQIVFFVMGIITMVVAPIAIKHAYRAYNLGGALMVGSAFATCGLFITYSLADNALRMCSDVVINAPAYLAVVMLVVGVVRKVWEQQVGDMSPEGADHLELLLSKPTATDEPPVIEGEWRNGAAPRS